MTTTRTGALTAAAILLTTGLAITACDPEQPDPTPTPTAEPTEDPTTDEPTEEPSLSYEDQQIAAAEEFVLNYYDDLRDMGHSGFQYEDIDAMFDYISGNLELWEQRSSGWEAYRERGESIEGGTEVVSIAATDWEEAPESAAGFDTVRFRLCLDSRSTVTIDQDGEPIDLGENGPPDHRYPAEIEVMGQPETELGWSLMEIETDGEASC